MQALNYQTNTYLAVTLASSSPYYNNPAALAAIHPSVTHVGPVGQLPDVQLLSISKQDWERPGISDEVMAFLNGRAGASRVDIQTPKQRVKRGGDEL